MKLFSLPFLSTLGVALAKESIVGGYTAGRTEFPYQVSIQTSSHFCGGSIISPDYILTAAHCATKHVASRLRVRVGSPSHNSGGQLVRVAEIISHADYNADTIENDIAVLRLTQSLQLGEAVGVIDLPPSNETTPETGAVCTVSGWGTTSHEGADLPTNLRAVDIKVIDHALCREWYEDVRNVTDQMVCAGVQGGGKDACQGDSGGPLVEKESHTQIGVVSWGYGCGQHGRFGVYADTAAYRDWIKENAGV
ncbi:trypsin-like cysteine/serine peptidase domain-containing protein [Aspergillus karnatakaensis]|uniref:S1 family serine peptidase n=1 Tax=Aspergillus karnatakaensis TaxID=1810916 RepID=UPI003CCCDC78